MQVYDELKILTNSPSHLDIKKYSCNLYNYIKYPSSCDLGTWIQNVKEVLLKYPNKIPIFVGGTGMYLDGLNGQVSPIPPVQKNLVSRLEKIQRFKGNRFLYEKLKALDPQYAKRISENDSQRIIRSISVIFSTKKKFSYWHTLKSQKIFKKLIYIVINHEREELYNRINSRCMEMIDRGCIQEIKKFLDNIFTDEHPLHKSIGFEIFKKSINGLISNEEATNLFKAETRHYAKRQITWFKNRSTDASFLKYEDAENFILKNF